MSITYAARANKIGHDVAMLEAEWGAARRADHMAFLWKDAINRMTNEQKQAELDALCWEWWARTRDMGTCKHDWDALFTMLHPLYVWWRSEDRKDQPMHPALEALEKWEQPASEFRLSEQLSAARGTLALLDAVRPV